MKILVATMATCLMAQAQPESLIGGGSGVRAFRYWGPGAGEVRGSAEVVPASGPGFTEALRMTTSALPHSASSADEGAVRTVAAGKTAVAAGDKILVSAWVRCVESETGECAVRLVIESTDEPHARAASRILLAGKEWMLQKALLTSQSALEPGRYRVEFHMGHQVQKVEAAAIEITRHPAVAQASDFGIADPYEGAEAGAVWRKAAEERIERLRKARLDVTVTDEAGKPVSGAKVRVKMTRHAFHWGTAVAASQLLAETPDAERYRKALLENFNAVVFENDLKWPQWERNRQLALDGLAWMRANGIDWVRGHTLIWPSWRWLPPDLPSLAGDKDRMRERAEQRIVTTLEATRGQLKEWDVLNEPFSNRDLMTLLGDGVMADWFKLAKKTDPSARMFINDFDILANGGANLMHINHYERTMKDLVAQGAPVEGIGLQGHFSSPTSPERMLALLDRFARFNVPIAITEYDYDSADDALQARFTADFMTVCFSHPSVSEFLMWGFWEGRHWRPKGAMIRRQWDPKPNHKVWRELVYSKWWTDETVASGAGGRAAVRGFLGDYEVEAAAGGRTGTARVSLGSGGGQVTVRLGY